MGFWRVIKDHPDDTGILTKGCDFLTRLLTLQSDRDSVSATCLEDAALLKTALSTSADPIEAECEGAWKTIVCRKLGILLAFTTINESGAINTLHASARGALRKDQTVTKVLADVTSRLQKLMSNPFSSHASEQEFLQEQVVQFMTSISSFEPGTDEFKLVEIHCETTQTCITKLVDQAAFFST